MTPIPYGFGRTVAGTLDELRPRVEAALKAEGFGVLTEIDVQATFKKKLDLDFRPYVILGACNPVLASKALAAEPQIGLLLPCNVVLQQVAPDKVEVSFADPKAMFTFVDNDGLNPVAQDAEARLRRALDAIG
ncbi:MAG: DUF302 domain-containing protein [Alphaproteobacteria bacterium]|nr:DUF302 domain-containing protein [Alphaproteobacteria bacterium]